MRVAVAVGHPRAAAVEGVSACRGRPCCRRVDLILHAGDVCTADVLDELSGRGLRSASVLRQQRRARRRIVGRAGPARARPGTAWAVAMIHDSGPAKGRGSPAAASLFPSGGRLGRVRALAHPLDNDRCTRGKRAFNPGSPTDRRRQPHGTMGVLDVEDAHITEARIVPGDLSRVVMSRSRATEPAGPRPPRRAPASRRGTARPPG